VQLTSQARRDSHPRLASLPALCPRLSHSVREATGRTTSASPIAGVRAGRARPGGPVAFAACGAAAAATAAAAAAAAAAAISPAAAIASAAVAAAASVATATFAPTPTVGPSTPAVGVVARALAPATFAPAQLPLQLHISFARQLRVTLTPHMLTVCRSWTAIALRSCICTYLMYISFAYSYSSLLLLLTYLL
jgi:hypothetical protein